MTTYTRLIGLLTSGGARYRLIDHPPEGRTHEASTLRGNPDYKAAKCIVARVTLSKKTARYALVVIPGNRRADLGRLSELLGGRHAVLALRETAEALTGCVSGSIIPFSFHPDLHLIVDPELLSQDEVFFNAARLDQSVALATEDYVTLAQPHIEAVASLGVLA
jgi:Ala-tRNA(Pro) deacylase